MRLEPFVNDVDFTLYVGDVRDVLAELPSESVDCAATSPPYSGHNYGPWQINTDAHPWASPYLLTHSWLYSARAAWRVSDRGTYWQPFEPDAGRCGAR